MGFKITLHKIGPVNILIIANKKTLPNREGPSLSKKYYYLDLISTMLASPPPISQWVSMRSALIPSFSVK